MSSRCDKVEKGRDSLVAQRDEASRSKSHGIDADGERMGVAHERRETCDPQATKPVRQHLLGSTGEKEARPFQTSNWRLRSRQAPRERLMSMVKQRGNDGKSTRHLATDAIPCWHARTVAPVEQQATSQQRM